MYVVKQALALPGVGKEIEGLSHIVHGQTLVDENFLFARFPDEISKNPFRVVHIASHGYFGGSPEQNFIMTYDKRMDMNTLENLIKPKQFIEQPNKQYNTPQNCNNIDATWNPMQDSFLWVLS